MRRKIPSSMPKYLYRTCPKCKDYLGVVVRDPPEPKRMIPIDATLPPVRVQAALENHPRKEILFDPDRTNRITGTGSRNVKPVPTPSAIKIP